MPEKLIPESPSSSSAGNGNIGILKMRHMTREKRRKVNITWLCVALALIGLVLIGFAFLLRNFFGHNWASVTNSLLGTSKSYDDDLPIYPYRGHSYDTDIPAEGARPKEEDTKSFTTTKLEERGKGQLFSENEQVQLMIIRRAQWGALPAKRKTYFNVFAIDKAIVLETGSESCFSAEHCNQVVRNLQKADLTTRDDIRYNFLVGGDGSIFEGRGFNAVGDHTANHNNISLGIALMGKFDQSPPPAPQVLSLRKLLQFGMAWEHLKSNYELFGHDQLVTSEDDDRGSSKGQSQNNPGVKLFEIIRKWPHWTDPNMNHFYKTNQ